MANIVLLDKEGWVSGVVITEGNFLPGDYPHHHYVAVSMEDAHKIKLNANIIWHDSERFFRLTDPKRIWLRLRSQGLYGDSCHREFDFVDQKWIESLPDEAGRAPIGTSMSFPIPKKTDLPSFEFHPGLIIRRSVESEVEVWKEQMVKSGLYKEDDAWVTAAEWLSNPEILPVATVWKNEILQLELYSFQEENLNSATAGFTTHLDRERPYWFWQQAAKPVFEHLVNLGVENVDAYIRADRPDWIQTLKDHYGAEELRGSSSTVLLRYKPKTLLNITGRWPERKLIANWSWREGNITIRQGTADDLPLIKNWLSGNNATTTIWSDGKRLNLVDKWYEIDNATPLLAFDRDNLIDVWLVRQRHSGLSGVVALGLSSQKLNLVRRGMLQWQRDVGYSYSSFFLKKELSGSPLIRNLVDRASWVEEKEYKHFDTPMLEFKVHLQTALSRTL